MAKCKTTANQGNKKNFEKYYKKTPVSGVQAENLLSYARISLLAAYPFWGKIALNMPFIKNNFIPTTGVDEKGRLYYNEFWVNGLTKKDAVFEIAHECGHLFTRCFSRAHKEANPGIWNKASDWVIDTMLSESGMEQSEVSKEMVSKETMELVKKLGYTHEAIYKYLIENDNEGNGGECKACKMIADMLANASQENTKQDKTENNEINNNGNGEKDKDSNNKECKSNSNCCGDEIPEHTCGNVRACCACKSTDLANTPVEDTQKWIEIIVAAKMHAEGKGNMPGILGEMVDSLTKSTVRWQDYLRSKSTSVFGRGEYTYKKAARRSHIIGTRLPGRKPEARTAGIAIDTSGSMSREDITQCLTEAAAIMRQSGASKVYLVLHDMPVYYAADVNEADLTKLKLSRGGTSHIEVFKCFDGTHEEFKLPNNESMELVVCFTDLGTDFPNYIPGYEVLWGVVPGYGENVDVPFGSKVKVELANA